jgi:predicted nuclease of restriction endonuclease-like (RecB) superfamily
MEKTEATIQEQTPEKFVFNDPVVLQFLDQLFQGEYVPPEYEDIFKANIEDILA